MPSLEHCLQSSCLLATCSAFPTLPMVPPQAPALHRRRRRRRRRCRAAAPSPSPSLPSPLGRRRYAALEPSPPPPLDRGLLPLLEASAPPFCALLLLPLPPNLQPLLDAHFLSSHTSLGRSDLVSALSVWPLRRPPKVVSTMIAAATAAVAAAGAAGRATPARAAAAAAVQAPERAAAAARVSFFCVFSAVRCSSRAAAAADSEAVVGVQRCQRRPGRRRRGARSRGAAEGAGKHRRGASGSRPAVAALCMLCHRKKWD